MADDLTLKDLMAVCYNQGQASQKYMGPAPSFAQWWADGGQERHDAFAQHTAGLAGYVACGQCGTSNALVLAGDETGPGAHPKAECTSCGWHITLRTEWTQP